MYQCQVLPYAVSSFNFNYCEFGPIDPTDIVQEGRGRACGTEAPWTKDRVKKLLMTNDRAVERAMVALYRLQTADEQEAGTTAHRNGQGFSGATAVNGTYYAKWVLSGKRLTGKHLEKARKIAILHHGQLASC